MGGWRHQDIGVTSETAPDFHSTMMRMMMTMIIMMIKMIIFMIVIIDCK